MSLPVKSLYQAISFLIYVYVPKLYPDTQLVQYPAYIPSHLTPNVYFSSNCSKHLNIINEFRNNAEIPCIESVHKQLPFLNAYKSCQKYSCQSILFQKIYSGEMSNVPSDVAYLYQMQAPSIIPSNTKYESKSVKNVYVVIINSTHYVDSSDIYVTYINDKSGLQDCEFMVFSVYTYRDYLFEMYPLNIKNESDGSLYDVDNTHYSFGVFSNSTGDHAIDCYQCIPGDAYYIQNQNISRQGLNPHWPSIDAHYGWDICNLDSSNSKWASDSEHYSNHLTQSWTIFIDPTITTRYKLTQIENFINKISIIDVGDTYIIFAGTISTIIMLLFTIAGVCNYHKTYQLENGCCWLLSVFFSLCIINMIYSFISYLPSISCLQSADASSFFISLTYAMINTQQWFTLIAPTIFNVVLNISLNAIVINGNVKQICCKSKCNCCKRMYGWCFMVLILICAIAQCYLAYNGNTLLQDHGWSYQKYSFTIRFAIWFQWIGYIVPLFTKLWPISLIFLAIVVWDFSTYLILRGINYSVIFLIYIYPVVTMCIFYGIKELNRFKLDILSIFLMILDLTTDIIIIYYWINSKDYWWALFMSFILITSHYFGYLFRPNDDDDDVDKFKLSFFDKILLCFGLLRPLYTIKSWTNDSYIIEADRLKIWQVLYQSFPSVALQLHVLTINSDYSTTILQSILANFLHTSLSSWTYLINKTNKNGKKSINNQNLNEPLIINNDEKDEFSGISSSKFSVEMKTSIVSSKKESVEIVYVNNDDNKRKYDHFRNNLWSFICIYLFIMTDFFIRSVPIIGIISLTQIYNNTKYGNIYAAIIFLLFVIGFIGFIEFKFCKWMRFESNEEYKNNKFIFKIFLISILSSIYNLFCCLQILKDTHYFGYSIKKFQKFYNEHILRMLISIILYFICIIILAIKHAILIDLSIGLIIIYPILFIINILSLKVISYYVGSPIQFFTFGV